ncbi:MAG: hypothetical protein Q4C89_04210 [Deinococcus sp.]|uniref:hypothetical protein n=1 Tax=Deinococcus sp. TaxID=47478 RepID=UPI0026DBDB6F|nr:hypothetical protein [Deinococcus sp.]MDO4245205.1 hypothetical protein [Deinococcus sp.]
MVTSGSEAPNFTPSVFVEQFGVVHANLPRCVQGVEFGLGDIAGLGNFVGQNGR